MMNQEEIIKDLAVALKHKYGDKYQIVTQLVTASIKGLSQESKPDIVLYDGERDKLMLIEVKGTSPNNDLPFGTVQVLKKVKEANILSNPKIVLASPSNVSSLVESQLLNEQIEVIKFNNKSDIYTKVTKLWDQYLAAEDNVPIKEGLE